MQYSKLSLQMSTGVFCIFFFHDTATTEIYTLSLHDALPIWSDQANRWQPNGTSIEFRVYLPGSPAGFPPSDRKSTRLNSSHSQISYAVFCLKKKNKTRFKLTSTRRLRISPGVVWISPFHAVL